MGCEWLPANHAFFQIANLFLAFSYLVPNSLEGLFLLRFVLSAAGLFFALWAWVILCSLDTLLWNLCFMAVNFGHVTYLLIKMRPIKFNASNESVYKRLFQPLGVKRFQYKGFADIAEVLDMNTSDFYSIENESVADRITLILTGSVEVSKAGQCLHYLKKFEFMDSPEWIAGTDTQLATFAVTLRCLESTSCLSWRRRPLQKLLRKDPFLKHIFDSLVGQDVTKKLFKSNAVFSEQLEGTEMQMKPRKAAFVYQPRDRRRTSII